MFVDVIKYLHACRRVHCDVDYNDAAQEQPWTLIYET